MAVIPILEAADPRLASYRDLEEPELVRRRGLFIAEGRLVVERLIHDARYVLQSLLLSHAAARALAPSLASLAPAVPIYLAEPALFAAVTGHDFHRGCLALVERPAPLPWTEAVREARLVVVLEAVANADNVGSVFRNAAAFGAAAVLLSPSCCDPLYRKAIRTSMAATLRVPFARIGGSASDWPESLEALGAAGFMLIALCAQPPALDIAELASSPPPAARLALLVGSEGPGLTPGALAFAHQRVRIPMRPEVDSLNLSVAVGIALHRLSSEA